MSLTATSVGRSPSRESGDEVPQNLKQFVDIADFLLQKRSKFENFTQFTS